MFELLFSLISTPFGIGGIVAVTAVVAAFFLMPGVAMRVAPRWRWSPWCCSAPATCTD